MPRSPFELTPGASCFNWGTSGATVTFKDGTIRTMTGQEYEWLINPPDDDIELLAWLNLDEAGCDVCAECGEFHPELKQAPARTAYYNQPQPQPLLCPGCTEEWHEYWNEMWSEYHSGLL